MFGRVPQWMLDEGLSARTLSGSRSSKRSEWYDNDYEAVDAATFDYGRSELGCSLRSLHRVITELRSHDALNSETAYSGG